MDYYAGGLATAAAVAASLPVTVHVADNVSSASWSSPADPPSQWSQLLAHFNGSEIAVYEHFRPCMTTVSRTMPPIWWSVGIAGNLVALCIWLQPLMRHSSGFYLAALALTDVGFLSMNVLYEMHFAAARAAGSSFLSVPGRCETFSVLYMALQYASPVLVLGFTVERYLSVCHPFRFVDLVGRARCAARCVALLLLVCLALAGVQGYLWTVGDDGMCNLRVSSMPLFEAWTWFTELLVFALLPLAVLMLNARVIVEVRRLSKMERLTTMTSTIDRRSTTALLLGVSFYQIFTILPSTIVYSLYPYFKQPENIGAAAAAATAEATDIVEAAEADPAWQRHVDFMLAKLIAQQIGMSHYAANFFIYVLTGKLFRRQLYELAVLRACGTASRVLRSGSSKFVGSVSTARTSIVTAVAAAAAAAQRRKSALAFGSRSSSTNHAEATAAAAAGGTSPATASDGEDGMLLPLSPLLLTPPLSPPPRAADDDGEAAADGDSPERVLLERSRDACSRSGGCGGAP